MWVPREDEDPVLSHAPTRKSVACAARASARSICAPVSSFGTFAPCSAHRRFDAFSNACCATDEAGVA